MVDQSGAVARRLTATSAHAPAQLAKIRSQLMDELRSRRAYARACETELDAARVAYAVEPCALTRIDFDFWTSSAWIGRKLAADVEDVLAHLSEEDFGVCRACRASIPTERLIAVPGSGLCAECGHGEGPGQRETRSGHRESLVKMTRPARKRANRNYEGGQEGKGLEGLGARV